MNESTNADAGHSIFISFSSKDRRTAKLICKELERRGLPCWISSRDVKPGENYQGAIVRAIKSAKLVVLLFTSYANNSEEIKKELSLASRFRTPVIPVRVEDVEMDEAFSYELATRQWINAFKDWQTALDEVAASAGGGRSSIDGAVGVSRSHMDPARAAVASAVSEARLRELHARSQRGATCADVPEPALQSPAVGPGPVVVPKTSAVSAEAEVAVLAALSRHLGPIARVLIKRRMRDGSSLDALIDALSAEIPGEADRIVFKRECGQITTPRR